MRRIAFALCLFPALAHAEDGMPGLPPDDGGPGSAQMQDGMDLLGQGLQTLLQGFATEMQPHLDEMGQALNQMKPMLMQLAELMKNVDQYEAPVMLENGDILIRRKPSPPAPPPGAPPQEEPEAGSQIDL